MKTALYRHFDAAGALLYVGISLSVVQRLQQHKRAAGWFGEIARVDVQWHPTREAALAAERAAICAEGPSWNVVRPKAATAKSRGDRRLTWAVVHPATTRRDGNYFTQEDADEMLAWWREQYPGEEFRLATAPASHPGGATGYAGVLRVETMGQWQWGQR